MRWIFHEREGRVIHSLTTDLQPVIYCALNHLLARLYFDSNTYTQNKTTTKKKKKKKKKNRKKDETKRQVYPSDVANFPPLHVKSPDKNFGCNRGVYMYFLVFEARKRRCTV